MFCSFLLALSVSFPVLQEPDSGTAGEAAPAEEAAPTPEQLDALFQWRTGEIALGDGLALLHLPAEFRYLEPAEARRVLEELWGNPPDESTLGMIFPADSNPFQEDGWAVVLSYTEDGHVSDEDAEEIDYDELLADMQADAREADSERVAAGFGSLEVVGWAARPHYDAAAHRLYWAKELRFEGNPGTTLNYDVRALGRKGVLSMNAVAGSERLAQVEQGMQSLLGSVEFAPGQRYEDFDSSLDTLAAYGIGGLIAGKVALKVGLFKGLLAALIAAKKLVLVGLVAIGAFVRRLFKKKEAEPAR